MKDKIVYNLRNKLWYSFYYFDIKICKYDSCNMSRLLVKFLNNL